MCERARNDPVRCSNEGIPCGMHGLALAPSRPPGDQLVWLQNKTRGGETCPSCSCSCCCFALPQENKQQLPAFL
jgi:hypothetical protein